MLSICPANILTVFPFTQSNPSFMLKNMMLTNLKRLHPTLMAQAS